MNYSHSLGWLQPLVFTLHSELSKKIS